MLKNQLGLRGSWDRAGHVTRSHSLYLWFYQSVSLPPPNLPALPSLCPTFRAELELGTWDMDVFFPRMSALALVWYRTYSLAPLKAIVCTPFLLPDLQYPSQSWRRTGFTWFLGQGKARRPRQLVFCIPCCHDFRICRVPFVDLFSSPFVIFLNKNFYFEIAADFRQL